MRPSAIPSGIEVRLVRFLDQPPDEFAHQGRKALVLLSANVVVFLPRTGFAPKRVPHGDFAGTGDFGVEIKIHHHLEGRDRLRLELGDGYQHLFLEFSREELQGGDQHRSLGLEVESDDAGRHFRDRHHLFHRRARRAVDVQGRDACIDQALALPAVAVARARCPPGGDGLFFARTHARKESI